MRKFQEIHFTKVILILLFIVANWSQNYAQVAINSDGSDPDSTAMLDVVSTNRGFLTPRMTESQREAISSPATGLLVYQTDGTTGFYYNEGTPSAANWVKIGDEEKECDPRTEIDSVAYNASYNGTYSGYVITKPGSYYLTDTIYSAQSGAHGIVIDASNVTLDLNGFVINGRGSTGSTGTGIYINGAQTNITIKNGFLDNWTEEGLNASQTSNSLFQDLVFSNNGGEGIITGDQNTIRHCKAYKNGEDGIDGGKGCNIIRCNSGENGESGMTVDTASQFINCTAFANTGNGITGEKGSLILGCDVSYNENYGISGADNCSIIKCITYDNWNSGIYVESHCLVQSNTSSMNNSSGIEVAGSFGNIINNVAHENDVSGIICTDSVTCEIRVESNLVTDNDVTGLEMKGPGGMVIKNTAAGNLTDFILHDSTNHAPVVDVTGVGDISGTTNANHPLANFKY